MQALHCGVATKSIRNHLRALKVFSLSLSNAMQSHVVAFSALVIPKIVNARRGNKSKFSQDILLLGGQSIWNTRKAKQRLTLIQDPSKERVCAIAAPKKNSGNALAWVQRVHEPVDLWVITFCTRIF